MMAYFPTAPFARDFETLHRLGAVGGLDDGALLARFLAAEGADRELAFGALIDRHGPMVLRVCLGVLGDRHDAEDAAQASFLALAGRARSIRRPGSLGPWLHGVALRTARRARAGAARRREVEAQAAREAAMREPAENRFAHDEDLHEEIDRLPARYRAAIVACDLEGLPHAQAAERLRVPVRTLQTRLYRGRDRLRAKLIRRGLGLAAIEAVLSTSKPTEAALSLAWKEATACAAASILDGASPASLDLVAERVVAWSQAPASGTLKSLAAPTIALLASSGLILGGAALASRKPEAEDRPPAAKETIQPDKKDGALNSIVRPLPKPDEIRQVLRETAEAATRLSREHPSPGSRMLLDISAAQSKAGDRDGALASIRAAEAESNGRKNENRYPYWPCTLATTMLDQGLRDEAFRTLQQAARELPLAPANPNQGYETAYKLSEIAREQVRAGDVEHARQNVRRIEAIAASALSGKSKQNAGLLLPLLAGAQAEISDLDGAFAALDRTEELGPKAEEARTKVASRIASKAGGLDPQAARRIVDRLNHEIADAKVVEVKWAMRQALITPLAKLGEIEKAHNLAKELAREMGGGPRQEAMKAFALLQKITYAQEAAGDDAGARESLHVSFDAVRGAADTDLGRSHIRSIAMALAYLGDLDGALRIAESLQPGQELGDVYPYVTWKLAVEGKTDRANEILRRSREELAAAWKELPDDRSKALEFNASKTASVLEVATTVHALAGEVDEALASFRQIPKADGNYRQRALTTLVITVAQSGDFRKALALALGCDDPEEKRHALQDVAMGVLGRLTVEAEGRRPADARPKNVE